MTLRRSTFNLIRKSIITVFHGSDATGALQGIVEMS